MLLFESGSFLFLEVLFMYGNMVSNVFVFSAKATYAAIGKTYAYLTPDLWKDIPLQKTPFSMFGDYLAKNHRTVASARD